MATLSEVKQSLYEELVTVLSNKYGLSDPYNHVDPVQTGDDQVFPSLNFETQVIPVERGLHSAIYVDEVSYTNGTIDSITYRRDYTLFYDVIASVGNDDQEERADLYNAVENHFLTYLTHTASLDTINEDIDDISVDGTSDESRPDDAVRGDRLSIELEFSKYLTTSDVTPMNTVAMELTVEEDTDDSHAITYDFN